MAGEVCFNDVDIEHILWWAVARQTTSNDMPNKSFLCHYADGCTTGASRLWLDRRSLSYVLNFLAALLGMHSVNKYTGTRHTTCMAVQKTAPATGLGLVLLNAKGSCAGSLYLQRKMRTVDYPGLRVEEAEARDRTGCQGCVHRWAAGSVLIEAWEIREHSHCIQNM